MPEAYKFRAFITYSHRDEEFVRPFHHALEAYRVPKPLVGQVTQIGEVPGRLGRLFRDRDELAAAPDLKAEIQAALRQSDALIAVCSPAAAGSSYVNEEIRTFKASHRSHRVFASIIDGEPHDPVRECFPQALKFEVSDDGQITSAPAEPIAADARPDKDGFQNAKLKIIAGLLGLDFEQLRQREAEAERARARRARFLAGTFAALAALAVAGGIVALIQRNIAQDREREAQDRLVQLHVERGAAEVRDDDLRNGWVWFAEALRRDHLRGAAETRHRQRIAAVRDQLPQIRNVVGSQGELDEIVFAGDDSLAVVSRSLPDRVASAIDVLVDLGDRTLWSRVLPDCYLNQVGVSVDKSIVFALGRKCERTDPSPLEIHVPSEKDRVTLRLFDARTGETRLEQSFPWVGHGSAISSHGTLLLLQTGEARARLYRIDHGDIRPQGDEIDIADLRSVAFSYDESKLALVQEKTLTFYKLSPQPEVLRRVSLPPQSFFNNVVFSPDAASAALYNASRVLILAAEAQAVHELEVAGGARIEEVGLANAGDKLYVSYETSAETRFTEIWQLGDQAKVLAKIDHEEPLGKCAPALASLSGRQASGSFLAQSVFIVRRYSRLHLQIYHLSKLLSCIALCWPT